MLGGPTARVLVVEFGSAALDSVAAALGEAASSVECVEGIPAAVHALSEGSFDIVVTELRPPCGLHSRGSGLELLTMAQQARWDVGFILAAERPTVEETVAALRLQASDVLLQPIAPGDLHESLDRTFRRLLEKRAARQYCASLEASVLRRTRNLERALRDLERNYENTLEALVVALDAREHETYAHSFRVRAYTAHLARLAGYSPALFPQLEHAALLHDLGKIAISDSILLKPAPLTEDEWAEMKTHPLVGEQILRRVAFLKPAAPIVRHHHERYDGSGYPDGLAGEQIPLGARIFAIADTLDAITSDRPYRQAPGYRFMAEEVRRNSGSQFDPRLAQIFLTVPEESWRRIREEVEEKYFRSLVPAV